MIIPADEHTRMYDEATQGTNKMENNVATGKPGFSTRCCHHQQQQSDSCPGRKKGKKCRKKGTAAVTNSQGKSLVSFAFSSSTKIIIVLAGKRKCGRERGNWDEAHGCVPYSAVVKLVHVHFLVV